MTNITDLPRTILVDVDGTLLKHWGNIDAILNNPPQILPGVKDKLQEWNLRDDCIIVTTGRKESLREFTANQLKECGITYDTLVMGCRRGMRIIINDKKPNSTDNTTLSIDLERNKGMEGLEI